jgi:hypothetical protein
MIKACITLKRKVYLDKDVCDTPRRKENNDERKAITIFRQKNTIYVLE